MELQQQTEREGKGNGKGTEWKLSDLWKQNGKFPIAVLTSDIHARLQTPTARAEKDWRDVLRWYFYQLEIISNSQPGAVNNKLPIICAGDVFDRWDSPAELINFCIDKMPFMYAIPGQHDLPLHNYGDIKKSAYWTLVQAGKIKNLTPGRRTKITPQLNVTGFPWKFPIVPEHARNDDLKVDGSGVPSRPLDLAVVHQYVWVGQHRHAKAEDTQHVGRVAILLKDFDAALFGDNHAGFLTQPGPFKCPIYNHGGFIPTRSDQKSYTPTTGVLMSDGSISLVDMHTIQDKWQEGIILSEKEQEAALPEGIDMSAILSTLTSLGEKALDFAQVLKAVSSNSKTKPSVREILLRIADQLSQEVK